MNMNDPLKKYRHLTRAWINKHRLRQELTRYNNLFTSRGLSIPDESDISLAMKKKYPQIKPKPKGSLQVLAIYHHYSWENDSLKPSLEKFGTVRHYDWFNQFNHEQPSWHKGIKAAMNRDLIEKVKKWVSEDQTDIIFTYLSGEIVSPETLQALSSLNIPMINLALNDKEHFAGRIRGGQVIGTRDICRYFDICWTSTEDALKKYCVEGATPIYLPEGANPDIHKPCAGEKSIDVSFIGQCYGNRPEIIGKLKSCGINIEAYGNGWPNGPLPTNNMICMYTKSRINLGFGGVEGHTDTFCLKGRDFEIPMSGGLYLTEHNPELERVYEIGKEILTYTDFADLVEKIRYLLAHPDEAEEIRQRGYLRARRDHSWESRFEKIFRLIGLIA